MKKTLQLFVALMVTATISAQDFNDGTFNYTILDATTVEVHSMMTPVAAVTIPAMATDSGSAIVYNVTGVGDSAFSINTGKGSGAANGANSVVETVSLPASVTYLASHSFRELSALTTINLDEIETLGENVFAACSNLVTIGSTDKITTLGNYCFNMCVGITSLELPALVTIGKGALYNSSYGAGNPSSGGLTHFNIPSTVTYIDEILLGRLWDLTQVQVNWSASQLANDVTILPTNFFRNLDLTAITLYVPTGTKSDYEAHALWGTFPPANIVEGNLTLSANTLDLESTFSAYPNPTNGIVTVKSNTNDTKVTVYDLNGRALLNTKLNSTKSEIDISNFSNGLYIFRVQSENGEFVKRILKQ